MSAVDTFIVYDNVQYTKKGWVNRNRILHQSQPVQISIPIKKGGHSLFIIDRIIADNWSTQRWRILNQVRDFYLQAPMYQDVFPLVENCLLHEDLNLFRHISYSIRKTREYMGLASTFLVSSELKIDHTLKGEDKVIAICSEIGAKQYINPIGGTELYSREKFASYGIDLRFLKSKQIEYKQFDKSFVPWLSIIDVLMFNDLETTNQFLKHEYMLL